MHLVRLPILEIGSASQDAYVADEADMASSFRIAEQDVFPQFIPLRMIASMEAGA